MRTNTHTQPIARKATRAGLRLSRVVLGRGRLIRFLRFANNELRFDAGNDLTTNGERLVQRTVIGARRESPEPTMVFDVGAHFGEWSTALLAEAGDARVEVHAFEPSDFTFARLQAALGDRAGMHLHDVGLSDAPGEATLHGVHEGAGSNSVVPFGHGQYGAAQQIGTVRLVRLDDLCADLGVQRIHLLKVDAEGHDLQVLRGASGMLSRQAVDVVQFEYNVRWIDARAFLMDVFRLVAPFGYSIGKVTPDGIEFYADWHPELETFREANFVAVPEFCRHLFPTVDWWLEA